MNKTMRLLASEVIPHAADCNPEQWLGQEQCSLKTLTS